MSRMGTLAFLIRHDLRLGWRDFRSTFRLLGDKALAALVGLLLLVMHAAAWSVTGGIFAADVTPASAAAWLAPGIAFVLLLMTAQTLNGLTKALYARGDLDLLLSSPFPARAVLFVRGLSVALGAATSAGIFVVPIADVGLLRGHLWSLALIPVLAAGALTATVVSLALALAMFALLGARRTRLAAQITATFIGAAFMLWLQFSRFAHVGSGLFDNILRPGPLSGLLALPVRAATGAPDALAIVVGGALALYALVTLAFGTRFARSALAAASAPQGGRAAARVAQRESRFATTLTVALRRKEWRLLRRDPWILSQLLLQVLYMSPMLIMLLNGGVSDRPVTLALAPLIVVVSYQVAASMTWLSLSGEDAPELLATAPVTQGALQLGKLAAVGQLTAMMAVLPLVWLAVVDWRVALVTSALAAIAVVMAMLLSLWHTKPARRSAFAARHRESKLLALLEMVMSMLLGVAAAFTAVGSVFIVVPLAAAAVILLINRPRSKRKAGRDSADLHHAAPRQPGQQPA